MAGTTILTILFFIIKSTWFSSKTNENKALLTSDSQDQLSSIHVQSVVSLAEDRPISFKVSGLSSPSQTIDLEAQLSGTIKKIFIDEGSLVKKGAPLFEVSIEDRRQKLESAKSLVKLREMQYSAAQRLSEKKFTSPISLADTKKNLADARLALTQARADMDHLIIRAPFSGIVNQIYVENGSLAGLGTKVCTLVNLNPIYLIIQVTEKIYANIKRGQRVSVRLADDRILTGSIEYISAVADSRTRMFEVKISVVNPGSSIPSGMTAVVEMPLKTQLTHKINPSWITLSKSGVMGVVAIERGEAVFYPVIILDSSPSYLYVSGLPSQLEIITVGQESVEAGSLVQAQLMPSSFGT